MKPAEVASEGARGLRRSAWALVDAIIIDRGIAREEEIVIGGAFSSQVLAADCEARESHGLFGLSPRTSAMLVVCHFAGRDWFA